jgi:hypothetical protein
MIGTDGLERFGVDQPARLDRTQEVARLATPSFDAAHRTSGQVAPDAELFVRRANGVVESEQVVPDNLDAGYPTNAVLVKPDLHVAALDVWRTVELLLNRRQKVDGRFVGRIEKFSPFLFVGAADDEFGSQILLLLRRPIADARHDLLRHEIGPEEVAEAFVVARLFAENATPAFVRVFCVVLAVQGRRVSSETCRSNFHFRFRFLRHSFLRLRQRVGRRVDDVAPVREILASTL